MKIYFPPTEDPKKISIAQGVESLEPDTFFWDKQTHSLFELVESQEPNVVFLEDQDINDYVAHIKEDHKDLKLVWMKEDLELDLPYIDYVLDMNSAGQLVNSVIYCDGQSREEFACDLLYFSDNVEPLSEQHQKWLISLGNKYNLKIYGKRKIMAINYLGGLENEEYKDAIASCKILLMFDDSLYNTALVNGVVPLSCATFNSYKDLDTTIERIIEGKSKVVIPTGNRKTYSDLAKEILEAVQ